MDNKDAFYRHFQASVSTLYEEIKDLSSFSAAGGERTDAVDHIRSGIARLKQSVSDSLDFLPAYDQRTYNQAIKALSDQLAETTAQFKPKKTFQFKPRTARTTTSPGDDSRRLTVDGNASNNGNIISDSSRTPTPTPASPVVAAEQNDIVSPLPTNASFPPATKNYNDEIRSSLSQAVRKPSFSAATNINISEQTGVHIILPQSASRATSAGELTDLSGCIVDMSLPTRTKTATNGNGESSPTSPGGAPFASLALRDIERSLIVAGHVSGPVHITSVKKSIIVVAARQVRIHECHDVDVYLHCGSRPIIEDCSGMRFAPCPGVYTTEKDTPESNQWDQVDDFKWLKADHSPNWSVLPEAERIPDEVWRDVVPGGPGVGIEDILKKVGLGAEKK